MQLMQTLKQVFLCNEVIFQLVLQLKDPYQTGPRRGVLRPHSHQHISYHMCLFT